MKVTLMGSGRELPADADYVIGANRLLKGCPVRCTAATRPDEIADLICSSGSSHCIVLYSGDTGFYSGAAALLPFLETAGIDTEILPGISSVQLLAARLGRPWQDWKLCSAHGRACDPVQAVSGGRPAFFLTGGADGPARLCARLEEAGLGQLEVAVGENLGLPGESVTEMTAAEGARRRFEPLNVLLVEAAPRYPRRVPGIPDQEFIRAEATPMTKMEVRAQILSQLACGPEDICWDVGSGTGSVSVEMALQCKEVWAVEERPEAMALSEANRKKFGAWNMHLVQGAAPEALETLPRPSVAFVGGSGGRLDGILQAIGAASPECRVCVSAITLETLHSAAEGLKDPEITQVSVTRCRVAGRLHMLAAQTPVFLITGTPR